MVMRQSKSPLLISTAYKDGFISHQPGQDINRCLTSFGQGKTQTKHDKTGAWKQLQKVSSQ